MDPEDIGALGGADGGDYSSRAIAFANWQAQEFFEEGLTGMADEHRAKFFKRFNITQDGKVVVQGFAKSNPRIKNKQ